MPAHNLNRILDAAASSDDQDMGIPAPLHDSQAPQTQLDTPVPTPPRADQQLSGNGVANGNRITRWCVGLQPRRGHRNTHCQKCKVQFSGGELRLGSATVRGGPNRFWHLQCLDAQLPDLQTLNGYCDLPESAKLEAQMGGGTILPIAEPERPAGPDTPDTSSTATPNEDDDDLLDDDAPDTTDTDYATQPLPGMEWWDSTSFQDILSAPSPTTLYIPKGVEQAVADFKHRLCVMVENAANNHNTEQETRAWKALLAADSLLFSDVRSQDGLSRRKLVADRLVTAEEGNWGALWAHCEQDSQQDLPQTASEAEKTAKTVSKLTEAGEYSRAAAAVWGGGPRATARAVEKKLLETQHAAVPETPHLDATPWPEDLRARLVDRLAKSYRRYPRRGAAGPGGARYEHWDCVGRDEHVARAVSRTLLRALTGEVPRAVQGALLTARLAGISKASGGTRVLGCGGIIRRLVGRALVQEMLPVVRAAVGETQFGLQQDGTGRLHRVLTTIAATSPDVVVVSMDIADAFSSLFRSSVITAVAAAAPDLLPAVQAWLDQASMRMVPDADTGETRWVLQQAGLDQGCPLSPALYALTVAPALAKVQEAMRTHYSDALVLAFLDDTYLAGSAASVVTGMANFRTVMAELGLRVNDSKTKVWSPNPRRDLPLGLHAKRVDSLPCVGAVVPYARPERQDAEADWRDVPLQTDLHEGCTASLQAFADRQAAYFAKLLELHRAGLSATYTLALARTWSQGAPVHLLRALPARQEQLQALDAGVADLVQTVLGDRLDETQARQLFLRIPEGGLGMGSAVTTGPAAWLGAWEGGLQHAAAAAGISSLDEFRRLWPAWAQAVDSQDETQQQLQGKTLHGTRWVRTLVAANPKQQQAHARAAQAHQRKRLLDSLPSLEQDKILQASGPGAGSFMQPAVDLPPMEDRHFLVALRRRLRVRHCVHGAAATCCHHTRADHRRCGRAMPGDNGTHAVSCRVGGGWEARHNAVRDAVGHWLEEGGHTVFYEQEVPRWNRPEERAVLDVVYRTLEGHTTYLDVSCLEGAVVYGRIRNATHGLTRRERTKHKRYPGPGLLPFVLDNRGRWGKEALQWVRGVLRNVPAADRAERLARLRASVAMTLQTAVADQIISASCENERRGWRNAS